MKPGQDAAQKLKDFRKKKKGPDEDDEDEGAESPEGGDSKESKPDEPMDDALEKLDAEEDAGVDDAPEAEVPSEEGEGSDEETDEDDGAKVIADKLFEGDEMTGQAVYAEAMSMPEYAEMSAEDIADKLDGDYKALKGIMMSMGRKAESAMKEAMNAPAEAPPEDMSGA